MGKATPWTEKEDAILREIYPRTGMGNLPALLPMRSRVAIKVHARTLGLRSPNATEPYDPAIKAAVLAALASGEETAAIAARYDLWPQTVNAWRRDAGIPSLHPPEPRWTDEEESLLRQHYPTAAEDALRALFAQRSWAGVQQRAATLGIGRLPRRVEDHATCTPVNDRCCGGVACIGADTLVQVGNGPRRPVTLSPGQLAYSYTDGTATERAIEAVGPAGVAPLIHLRTTRRGIVATGDTRALRGTIIGRGVSGFQSALWGLEWARLDELARDDLIVTLVRLPEQQTTATDPLLRDKRFLWLLGVMMGDGSLSRSKDTAIYCCVFGELRERVQSEFMRLIGKPGTPHASHGVYTFNRPLHDAFARYGVDRRSTEREVPAILWQLPHDAIRAFLEGYTDADGHRSKRERDPAIQYNAASRALVEQVRNLHLIVGHNVSVIREQRRTKPIIIKGKEVKNPKSLWSFRAYPDSIRKGQRWRNKPGLAALFPEGASFGLEPVTNIAPCGEGEVYQIVMEGHQSLIVDGLVVR